MLGQKLSGNGILEALRQYRTIRGSCLDGTSACIFSVIRHKNSSQRGDYAREFLFRLTKNLSAHLYHQNCAVLPYTNYLTLASTIEKKYDAMQQAMQKTIDIFLEDEP